VTWLISWYETLQFDNTRYMLYISDLRSPLWIHLYAAVTFVKYASLLPGYTVHQKY